MKEEKKIRKKIKIEDLLPRDPIRVDLDAILGYVKGKTILVTGGGGSIGSEICRQLAGHDVGHLIIFDIYENNAYQIQKSLEWEFPDLNLTVLIGSVRDERRLESIFSKYRPDIVFHAAAHKHVPLMEDSPNEAIKNNVIGTLKTARTASHYQVKKFILISTDKAVNPTNIMGASKRLCEMVIQLIGRQHDRVCGSALWKCTGKQRKCHSAVPPSDRTRRSGDGYASGYHSIFYDDSGGSQPCT